MASTGIAAIRRRRAQTTVEYMLVVSVLAIAMFSMTEFFWGPFSEGTNAMFNDIEKMTSEGYVGGS